MAAGEFVHVAGARLWTATQGSGPPLLLCHGGPGLWDYLDDVAEMLEDLVTVHRFDQRGCGRSEDVGPYTVDQAVEDIEALREHWGYGRWMVGGHSWGANLALAYATTHRENASALLYVSGTGPFDGWQAAYRAARDARLSEEERARVRALRARLADVEGTPEFAAVSDELCRLLWATDFADRQSGDELVDRVLHPEFRPNYRVNEALNGDWRRVRGTAGIMAATEELARLDQPALVVHGTGDPRPLRQASDLASWLPRGRLAVIQGCGHYPWIEQPDAFRNQVRAFVEAAIRPDRPRGQAV